VLKGDLGTPLPNEGHISVRIIKMTLKKPASKPSNPHFSSGPCTKPPTWTLKSLSGASLGRSHRSTIGKQKLQKAIDLTRKVLRIPNDFKIGIVPASDTGAFELAMWNLLGRRHVEMLAWESFGAGWITDAITQLKLEATIKKVDYGKIVDFNSVNFDNDVCFTWNGTTSGVKVSSKSNIPIKRKGLTLCDATSAAFAMDLPWDRLDATTFSWQKVLGGEGGHGIIVLSPHAIERLLSYTPIWPLPKIFRLKKDNKLIEGIFSGETINTPSMLCVEDYLFALDWAESIGGLPALIDRSNQNAKVLNDFVLNTPWLEFLAVEPDSRSNTSVCLLFNDHRIKNVKTFIKSVVKHLENEGVALDINAHKDAPPGLRIWCGATVEKSDLLSLVPWITWAFQTAISDQA
jgi:phosphoserine aminotransferase